MTAAVAALSGCNGFPIYNADVYTIAAEPYRSFTDENIASSECRIEFTDEVHVHGQGAWFSSDDVTISEGGIYIITGSYSGGGINVTAKEPVKLIFDNAEISNPEGYAVSSSCERLVISSESGTNKLCGCGDDFGTAVYSSGDVVFAGTGELDISGGIFSVKGINFGRETGVLCEILRASNGYIIPNGLSIN